jgi:flagellar biosynthesis protein FlhG
MSDQAAQLRHLVLRAARQREAESLPPPRIVAVLGAQPGVGATTIAAQLARGIVEQGDRVVLIDADPSRDGLRRSSLADACGLTEATPDYDPSIARHDIHEALFRAPGGVQIVPGVWDDAETEPSEKAAQQLMRQFQQLGRHADVLVIDLGACLTPLLTALSETAETMLLVTSTDDRAVMDAYATIKQSLANRGDDAVHLLVNREAGDAKAREVFHRVDRSCRRFLNMKICYAGHVPIGVPLAECLAALAAKVSEAVSSRGAPPRSVA